MYGVFVVSQEASVVDIGIFVKSQKLRSESFYRRNLSPEPKSDEAAKNLCLSAGLSQREIPSRNMRVPWRRATISHDVDAPTDKSTGRLTTTTLLRSRRKRLRRSCQLVETADRRTDTFGPRPMSRAGSLGHENAPSARRRAGPPLSARDRSDDDDDDESATPSRDARRALEDGRRALSRMRVSALRSVKSLARGRTPGRRRGPTETRYAHLLKRVSLTLAAVHVEAEDVGLTAAAHVVVPVATVRLLAHVYRLEKELNDADEERDRLTVHGGDGGGGGGEGGPSNGTPWCALMWRWCFTVVGPFLRRPSRAALCYSRAGRRVRTTRFFPAGTCGRCVKSLFV